MNPADCPVCERGALQPFQTVQTRRYFRCPVCAATVLDPQQHPTLEQARAEYDRHQNAVDNAGYRAFFQPLVDRLAPRLPPGAQGLDFGCGPGPALAALLRERGFSVALYDPLYAPDTEVLGRHYDFITCTEVIEHLPRPAETVRQLRERLRPGGWLGLMTRFQTEDARFAQWHYRRDPTHVVFFREGSVQRLAAEGGWHCETWPPNLALLRKPEVPA